MQNIQEVDIPESEVQKVMDSLEKEGCTNITKEEQANGLWTVRATCPDEEKFQANYLTDI
jgi:hypothetical protein